MTNSYTYINNRHVFLSALPLVVTNHAPRLLGFECRHDDYSSDMTNWADPVDSFDIDAIIPMFPLPEWYYIVILFALAVCVSYYC